MPRYFFHLRDGLEIPDDHGQMLPDLTAARCFAVSYSGQLLTADPSRFWSGSEWVMTVTDAVGLYLFELHFLAINAPSTLGQEGHMLS